MADLIGQSIGPYLVVAQLGKGGMGDVYRARQTLGGGVARDVALKLIDSRLAAAPEFVARFKREAETLVALSHPHILKAFDFGEYRDTVYLVMELMPGGNLADLIRKEPLPFETITRLLDQIGSALDYAHSEGVIHRDLKPQNVLLDKTGNAFLTDFGIAKLVTQTSALTHTNEAVGTPAYMAPEQWLKSAVDSRADLYSLGVMLFEMIGGRAPFQGDTPYRIMHMHANEMPPLLKIVRPDAPPALDRVIQKAMAKDPADRYQSAAALTSDVKAALSGGVLTAPPLLTTAALPDTPTSVVTPVAIPGPNTALQSNTVAHSGPARGVIGLIVGVVALAAVGIGVVLALIGARQSPPTATPLSVVVVASTTAAALSPSATLTQTATGITGETNTGTASTTATAVSSDTPTATVTAMPSVTLARTNTSLPSATSTLAPTATGTVAVTDVPTLSIPELAGTVKAQSKTQTATLWTLTPIQTATPTPNVTASIAAYLTQSAASEAAQVAAHQTATAALWTLTWTPTNTLAATDTPTVPTLTPSDIFTPSATPYPPVIANSDWTPQTRKFKGVSMVLVPPGCFMMGSDNGRDNEKPTNQVCFAIPFWLDEYPVTQAQFKQFGGQAAHSPQFLGDKQPVEEITWFEARNYCEANRGGRLLTEAEYEYATRGPDALIYAWGNTFDPSKVVYHNNSNGRTADIGSPRSNVSWVGAVDLIGNVWEWTSSIYEPYPYDAHDGRENPSDTTSTRVLRGNSGSDLVQRAAVRIDSAPTNAGPFGGFRCARAY